ncbi:hypothetical protein [Comamonas odontotermitis]|uniref:hypothetical protein n=1 Tax=Comamonas odontotermitis TaxID=379895 RepID=UPI001CC74946|nr:hypothetical protein [Comamonas odontotermitis]UBB18348.1 hypothetical protein LAD35_06840 [Comamonas odontotermitis]
MKLSTELQERKRAFQGYGYLMEAKSAWRFIEWRAFKRNVLFGWNLSRNGPWETLKASGTATVNYFVIQRLLMISKDGELLQGWQIVLGPLLVNFSVMKEA